MHGTYQPSPRGKSGARGADDATSTKGRGRKRAGPTGGLREAATGGAHAGAGKGAVAERASIYDEVTARIIGELEGGRVPWVQPWASDANSFCGTVVAMPRNAVTARAYSGVNILLLWFAGIEGGHAAQHWLTFRQALAAGGSVRKGERGTTIVYADSFTPQTERVRAEAAGETPGVIPFLKRFTVFNVAQCEGLPEGIAPAPLPLPEREIVPLGESLIAASGVDFRIGGGEAIYSPAHDFVQVPPQAAFFDQINWYRTALHELTHATSHPTRLDRKLTTDSGSKDYGREELVAELGSAFLCASLGIVPTVRHADYIGGWLAILREDNRAIFRAASAASKAADWLLARLAEADAARRAAAAE